MSIRAQQWAWRQIRDRAKAQEKRERLRPAECLVLLKAADHADQDGVCWPGNEGLAEWTGRDESTVRDALAHMESLGLVERERRAAQRGRGRGADRIILKIEDEDQPGISPGNNQPGGFPGNSTADQPGISPGETLTTNRGNDPDQPGISPGPTGEMTRPYIDEPKENHQEPPHTACAPAREPADLPEQIVEAFNAQLGTRCKPSVFAGTVSARVRENPELTLDDHRAIIAAAAERPWWRGQPSPRVIYCSPEQFHTALGQLSGKKRAGTPEVAPGELPPLDEARQADWDSALEQVRGSLPATTYAMWIEPLAAVETGSDDTVTVVAPARIAAWVQRRYSRILASAVSLVTGREMQVEIRALSEDA